MTNTPTNRRSLFLTFARRLSLVAAGAAVPPTASAQPTIPEARDFKALGSGSVARRIEDKLRDTVSITDFGASVSAADNSAAIERAIVAAMAAGRAVHIPAGTFRYTRIDFRRNDAVSPERLIISGPGTLRCVSPGTSMVSSQGPFFDLIFDGVRFESEAGAGTALIDGDKFIRLIFSPGTQVSEFDWVIRSRDYLQSVRMIGCIIRGGRGAVVKARMAYDCIFTHNIIEFVTDGIVIDGTNNPAVHTCTIDDNIMEGLGGRAIVLAACLATTITGNYFEGNAVGDVLLNAGTAPHKGLKVRSNSFQISDARLKADDYAIKWGASTALPVQSGGNYCNGRLHDTTGVTSIIDMSGDFAVAELYKGFKEETSLNRSPIGRAIYNDGLSQYYAWFDRYLSLDPYQNEVRFGGKFKSVVGGGQHPPVITFAAGSPAQQPGNFERKNWARGSVVFNAMAAPGQPAGWICVSPGAPGKWAPIAVL